MKGILYHSGPSPPSRAVRMVIDILGLDVDFRVLNPLTREQDSPELVQKNPMKTVPMYDEGEFSMGDSHAIIIYLMETYGKKHTDLYPPDKKKRATVLQRLFFDCGILFPSLQVIMALTYTGRQTELTRSNIRRIERAYGMLEVYLSQSLYVAGNEMTIADLSILSTMFSLDGLCPVDEKRFPKLKRWFANMNKKDVCKRINTPGGEEHVLGLKAFLEHNKEQLKSKL